MRALLVAAVAAVAVTIPHSARAADCGRAVLRDWSDGHFSRAYTTSCYQQALAELPEDLRIYSSAETDIRRQLLRSLASGKRHLASRPARPQASSGGRSWTSVAGVTAVASLLALVAGAAFVGARR